METNNPYIAPGKQNHHTLEEASGYPLEHKVRAKKRLGLELWPLNMAGTTLVWGARTLTAIMYYIFFTNESSSGVTFFDQVRYAWEASGPSSGYVKFMMTSFFVIPFVFLVLLWPGTLMRTRLFTLPDDPPPPPRKWWHWLAGK